jgi:hypothetical protein
MSQPHQYIGEDLGHVVRETDDPVEVEVRDAAALEESEAIPEGPTVTRWEEWAYYLYYVSMKPWIVLTAERRLVSSRGDGAVTDI